MSSALTSVLGVDYGTKFTGVAVSHGGYAPRPLRVLRTENPWTKTANLVASIATEEKVEGIVVGMPCYASGNIYDRKTDSIHVDHSPLNTVCDLMMLLGSKMSAFRELFVIVFQNEDQRIYLFDEFGTSVDADRGIDMVLVEGDGSERFSSLQLERRRSRRQKTKSKQKGLDAKAAAMLLVRYFQDPGSAIEVQQ